MIYFKDHVSIFSKFFLIFSFVTSFVIMGLPAATPSYLLAFTIPLFFIYKKYIYTFHVFTITCLLIFTYYLFSQFSCYIFVVKLNNTLTLITKKSYNSIFRMSHLTQHLYLLPGVLTFIYMYYFYDEKFEKYLKYGLYLLLIYGFVEWIVFLVFRTPLEIFSNRTFGDGKSGSLIQNMTIAGINILRFKSLTGEPSMYAFSVLPYLAYFYFKKEYLISIFLFVSLLLSTSSTAIIGLCIMILYYIIEEFKTVSQTKLLNKKFVTFLFFFLLFSLLGMNALTDLFKVLFVKVNLGNHSGLQRYFMYYNHIEFWKELNWLNKLVGVGFGTIRSTDMFTTLLVNTGIIGLVFYTIIFFIPLFKLKNIYENKGLKIGMIILWFTTLISVPEFSYLSFWIFIGMSYRQIKITKKGND